MGVTGFGSGFRMESDSLCQFTCRCKCCRKSDKSIRFPVASCCSGLEKKTQHFDRTFPEHIQLNQVGKTDTFFALTKSINIR